MAERNRVHILSCNPRTMLDTMHSTKVRSACGHAVLLVLLQLLMGGVRRRV